MDFIQIWHADYFVTKEMKTDDFTQGDNALLEFADAIANVSDLEPSDYQLCLLDGYIVIVIYIFFYDLIEKYGEQILRRYGVDLYYLFINLTQRRGGKTAFIQLVAAATAMYAPRRLKSPPIQIAYLSNKRETARTCLSQIASDILPRMKQKQGVTFVDLVDTITFYLNGDKLAAIKTLPTGEVIFLMVVVQIFIFSNNEVTTFFLAK